MASEQQGLPLDLIGETHDCCECRYWRRHRCDDGYGRCGALDMTTYERGGGCRLTFAPRTDSGPKETV